MEKTLSFASQVKEELVSNNYESMDRLKALLSAYIRINGHVSFKRKETTIILQSENAKIAKFFYSNIKKIYDADCRLEFIQRSNLKKKIRYDIFVDSKGDEIIDDLEISFLEGKISKNIVRNDDSISGYLAGAFIASGSVNSPVTSNYHLEISLNSENYAKWMLHLFSRYKNTNLNPKIIKRREKYVIYLKKSDQIAEFLVMIGATASCLEFESYRVDRDFANAANRLANFDTSNMKKTVDAAQKQVKQIKYIDEHYGISNLRNPKARLLCKLRLEFESASLNDLAKMMSDELEEEITRSNVAHLFRYLDDLYYRIGGTKL